MEPRDTSAPRLQMTHEGRVFAGKGNIDARKGASNSRAVSIQSKDVYDGIIQRAVRDVHSLAPSRRVFLGSVAWLPA